MHKVRNTAMPFISPLALFLNVPCSPVMIGQPLQVLWVHVYMLQCLAGYLLLGSLYSLHAYSITDSGGVLASAKRVIQLKKAQTGSHK